MGLYDGIKDVAKVLQQADNVDLYVKLLDLSSQALEMQSEIARLKQENVELKKQKDLEDKIVRYSEPYITLKDDHKEIKFCSCCWDSERKLIQIECDNIGCFKCPHCSYNGIYDRQLKANEDERQSQAILDVYNNL